MKALILSAGIGKRMRPITDHLPKPLLPIAERTLLRLQIDRLSDQGIEKFGINLFHHAQAIKKTLEPVKNIEIVIENEILGTGGALVNFKNWTDNNFYVQACDMLSDLTVDDLARRFHDEKPAAAISLIKTGSLTDNIEIDDHQRMIRVREQASPDQYTYAGAAIYSPEIFLMLPDRKVYSVVDLWHNLLDHGKKVTTLVIDKKWHNINTPRSYLDLVGKMLHNEWMIAGHRYMDPVYIHASSRVQARIQGFASIGADCVIESAVSLRNVVIIDNTRLSKGEYHDSIISGEFQVS